MIPSGQQETRDIGSDVTFECRAVGVPLPVIEWYKDGDLILASLVDVSIEMSTEVLGVVDMVEASVSTLQVSNISPNDGGTYSCRASNAFSADTLRTPYSLVVRQPTPCSTSPCQNGGRCTVSGVCFQCECAAGFTGGTCGSGKPTDMQLACV